MDRRIITLALRTLEDVALQAEDGIVERHWGHKLALQVLVRVGVALPWQAKHFWTAMADPIRNTTFPHHDHYIRSTALEGCLGYWRHAAGMKHDETALNWNPYASEFVDMMVHPVDGRPMCNRAKPGSRDVVTQLFDIKKIRTFNDGPAIMHPRDPGLVILQEDGELVLDQMTWGFPFVLRGKKGQPLKPKPVNNARFDKLNSTWRNWAARPEQRCLIPTERYAEAVGEPGNMTTTWLSLKSQPVFAWAGLWRNSEEWGPVFTGVMSDNAPELSDIHDRSPVILAPEDWQTWLTGPFEDLYQFDRPWPAEDVHVERTRVLWKDGGDVSRYAGQISRW